jgi:hypothetical protein
MLSNIGMTPPLSSRASHHSLTSPYIHTYERQAAKQDTTSNELPALLHSAYPLKIHHHKIPIHTSKTTSLVQHGPTYFHSANPPSHSPMPTLLSHHALKIFTRHTHRTPSKPEIPRPQNTYHIVHHPHDTTPNTPPPYLAEACHGVRLQEKHEMGSMSLLDLTA